MRASGWRRATVLLGWMPRWHLQVRLRPSACARATDEPEGARGRRKRAKLGSDRLEGLAVEPGDPRDARGRDLRPGTWRGRPEGRRQPSENTSGRARPSRSPVLAPDARTPRIRDARIEDHANALGVRRNPDQELTNARPASSCTRPRARATQNRQLTAPFSHPPDLPHAIQARSRVGFLWRPVRTPERC